MAGYTLVFDIGKTNKKCLLFDSDFIVRKKVEVTFDELEDDDGFFGENVALLTTWLLNTFNDFYAQYGGKIRAVNFSAYGASFVHLDENNEIVLPLYNYLKPVTEGYFNDFYVKYNGKDAFSARSASPALDFLNAGLQILWIKNEKPTFFARIKNSLHFPNYCSFLFHGKLQSEYTSIGCHTGLWDFESMDYHRWVKEEGILPLLPETTTGTKVFPSVFGDDIDVGVGLHDSSAALIPYLFGVEEKFILISTGTWSITLNPFNEVPLTKDELDQDCLQFLRVNGSQVKASRLFLGNEFGVQINILNDYFSAGKNDFKAIKFEETFFEHTVQKSSRFFNFKSFGESNSTVKILDVFPSFKAAYYQLCYELVLKQVATYSLAKGETEGIETVFIDGGFSNNEVFCAMLSRQLSGVTLKRSKLAAASALGAAVAVRPELFTKEHFNNILAIEKIN